MKHLLTLLLFISTSVMGENFRLVCEGSEKTFFDSNYPTMVVDKVIDIEVTDDFIKVENRLIDNHISSDNTRKKLGRFFTNSYKKTTDLIEFSSSHSKVDDDRSGSSYVGTINRLTAEITITSGGSFARLRNSMHIFTGTCKKTERAF